MQAMLEHVAREAATSGYDIIATLAAGAAEAARQELIAIEHVDQRRTQSSHRKDRVAAIA